MIPILNSVGAVGSDRPAWLVDVWGVIHNGVAPFADAVAACARRRADGGTVVLLTNAPRPAPAVLAQLDRIGVDRAAFDGIVTSGDVARGLITVWKADRAIHHLGPERDQPLFEGLDIDFATTIDAEVVICTGLENDERETPEDYRRVLDRLRRRNAVMVCANPDITVERGDKLVYCAGALGQLYEEMGGEVVYAGKPHGPIYELARSMIDDVAGRHVPLSDMLAIGDGVHTDIKGAALQGMDSLYIASAVNLAGGVLTDETLAATFANSDARPLGAMAKLAWPDDA